MTADINSLEKSLERYKGFLQQDPDNPGIISKMADVLVSLGQLDRSRRVLERGLEANEDNPLLLSELGRVALAQGRSEEALAIYEKLYSQDQNASIVRHNYAYALLFERQFQAVIDLLTPHLETHSLSPEEGVLLARAHYYLGNLQEVISNLRAILSMNPALEGAAGLLAMASQDAGETALATEWANKALELNPKNHEALITLGNQALDQQDISRSEDYFQQTVDALPTSGRGWAGLGLSSMMLRDLEQARIRLEKAVQHMPDHIGTWQALAWVLLVLNDLDGAETAFQHAMTLDRNFAENHGGLAVIQIMKGNPSAAKPFIDRAIRLDPTSFSARFARTLLISMTQPERAQKMIQAILDSEVKGEDGVSLQSMLVTAVSKQPKRPDDTH